MAKTLSKCFLKKEAILNEIHREILYRTCYFKQLELVEKNIRFAGLLLVRSYIQYIILLLRDITCNTW